MTAYNYQPLQNASDTRLLYLQPASHYNDELICSLAHISLESNTPAYEALSYVWNNSSESWTLAYNWSPPAVKYAFYPPAEGEHAPLSPDSVDRRSEKLGGYIKCDGQQVHVGQELYDALRRLRLTDRVRALWIDALCINQENISERNSQVTHMSNIYSQAGHVLIWVGEHFQGGPAIQGMMDFIKELAEVIMNMMNEYGPYDYKAINKSLVDGHTMHFVRWCFLRELLSRAWFGRVWVLQEVVNAKKATLYAGSGHCDWDTICGITQWLSMYDQNSPLDIKKTICSLPTVNMIWNLSRRKEDPRKLAPPRLFDVLRDSRLCKSTYPIDKVYGILGLVCEEDAARVPIDYEIEAGDLYTRIAIGELERNGLDILCYCTKSGTPSTVNCPSWVPDWSQPYYHQSFLKLGYKASSFRRSPTFRIEGKTLVVKGRILDTVTAVDLSRRIPSGSDPKPETKKEVETAEPEERAVSRSVTNVPQDAAQDDGTGSKDVELPPFTQEPDAHLNSIVFENKWFSNVMDIAFPNKIITAASYEAFWRTCCCNRTPSGSIPGPEFAESFTYWTKGMTGVKLRDFEEFHDKAMDFMESFNKYCDNRRFFRTRDGRIGWGAEQVRDGDVVGVLGGACVPFVLRPAEKGFEIVGDAFVYGVMDGEAMSGEVEEIRLV